MFTLLSSLAVFLGQQTHLLCLHYCRLWRSFYRRSANPLFCVYLSVVFVLQCIISCLQEGDRPGQHLRPAGPSLHQLRKGTTALSRNITLSQHHSLTTTLSHNTLSHNNSTLSQQQHFPLLIWIIQQFAGKEQTKSYTLCNMHTHLI